MFKYFTIGMAAHCAAGSMSYGTSPRDIPSPSPPSEISPLDIKHSAQSSSKELTSQPDELKPPRDEISASYLCTSSNSIEASEEDDFCPVDLTVDSECENELAVDPDENDSIPAHSIPPSLSTFQLCRRLQQQLDSHSLCGHSQVQAISELVEEMVVSTDSQPDVVSPAPTTETVIGPPETPLTEEAEVDDNAVHSNMEDEGYCEGRVEDDEMMHMDALLMSLRRSSGPLGIRRQQESIPDVVFAKPRMRRRILMGKRPENRTENLVQVGT